MQQTLTRTREKVLLGVAHRYEEYPLVVDSLSGFQFSRIGLELSPRELHASLHRDPLIKWPVFFGSLAAHYNGLGIEITPLDHPMKGKMEVHTLLVASLIEIGARTESGVRAKIEVLKKELRNASDPIDKLEASDEIDELERALHIARRGNARERFDIVNHARNTYMLEQIALTDTPVAVVGAAHAAAIASALPDYSYMDLSVTR